MTNLHRKPGDVASTPLGRALLTESAETAEPAWITEQADVYTGDAAQVRPLAVLDHADQGSVDRLCGLMLDAIRELHPGDWAFNRPLFRDALAAALERYTAEPPAPRPAEPAEVGALVTDIDGHVWARTAWDAWQCLSQPRAATWDDIDVAPELP
ncbi:MAG TPA: hypothetical protein VJL80_09790 [Aeromicrobium sp.]|nr:hypothetical protein [Aeromicrobium sp.]HKY58317.1 hypothetical protein [Aeromicrobium sp.]